MLHRRSTIPALLLALPLAGALTSCGFDYPTDRAENPYGPALNDREGSVAVLGPRIVSSAAGQGRLIGTFANNATEDASLVSVASEEAQLTADVQGVNIAPGGRVNLAEDVEVPVSGEFTAGEVLPVTYEFSTGESVEINVPVVKNCFQYADIEIPAGSGSEAEGATEESTEAAEAGEEHATGGDATYLCEHETHAAEGH